MSALAVLEFILKAAEGVSEYSQGEKQNREIEEMNKEGRELAEVTRQDVLGQQKIQNRQSEAALGMSKKALEFKMDEAEKDRDERMEEKGYNRMQRAANKFAEYLNFNNAYQQSKLSAVLNR